MGKKTGHSIWEKTGHSIWEKTGHSIWDKTGHSIWEKNRSLDREKNRSLDMGKKRSLDMGEKILLVRLRWLVMSVCATIIMLVLLTSMEKTLLLCSVIKDQSVLNHGRYPVVASSMVILE